MAIKFTSQGKPAKKSTAALKEVPLDVATGNANGSASRPKGRNSGFESLTSAAGTQALPVDTNPRSAESGSFLPPQVATSNTLAGAVWDTERQPKFDRNEYQRLYMRDKSTIKRLGLNMTVAQYRESLK